VNQQRNHIENYFVELLTFIFFCFAFALLGAGLIVLLGNVLGFENTSKMMQNLTENSTANERNQVRLFVFLNHVLMFVLPCLAYAIFRYRSTTFKVLHLNKMPHPNNILYSSIIILVALPFVMLLMWINQQVPLSQAMIDMEKMAAEMTKNLLILDSIWELVITLLVVAVTPAIGEELMFRGILQPIFEKLFKNGHVAVWVAAILFSAIHFQMQGFLPRMFLGAILGYFYLWTRNLWIPMFAHFVFNGSQVLATYLGEMEMESANPELSKIIVPSLVSLGFLLGLGYLFWKFNQSRSTTFQSGT
jgi:membrane protease YdiL (CAAX protease family)